MLLFLKTSTDFKMMRPGEYLSHKLILEMRIDYFEGNNIYSQASDMTARAGVNKELKRLQVDQLSGFTRDEIGELIRDVCCY